MKKLVTVEASPVMRLALDTLLAGLSHSYEIVSFGIEDLDALPDCDSAPDLVVLGLPANPYESWGTMALVGRRLRPKRVLLLSDSGAPWHPEHQVLLPSVYACIDKSSSPETFMAAVHSGLSENPGGLEPMHAAASENRDGSSQASTTPIPLPDDLPSTRGLEQACQQPGVTENAEATDHCVDASGHEAALPSDSYGKTSGSDTASLRITPRQHDVLALLARGLAMKKIARALNISPATAKCHAASLYRQLNARTKEEAVYIARQLGLLQNPSSVGGMIASEAGS